MKDIDVVEMVRVFEYLDPLPDIVQRLDRWGTKWYKSQKVHCMEWFTMQAQGIRLGRGEAQEADAHRSGRRVYNRLKNTGMLVWIAAAFGVDDEQLERAVAATAPYQKKTECQASCVAFRKVLPFDAIADAYEKPQGWRLDPAMLEFIVRDENGNIDENQSDLYRIFKVMDSEYGMKPKQKKR